MESRGRNLSSQGGPARPAFDFRYLAFGGGVQSSALAAMSALEARGCPKVDVAIFADTGDEPEWVYRHVEIMRSWLAARGVPLLVVQKGVLSADVEARRKGEKSRLASIPAFTRGRDGRVAPLARQCTREYKVEPIEKKVRELLGYRPRQRIRKRVACLLGISWDEIERMRPSRTPWIENQFPLIDARMTRRDCVEFLREVGLPVPQKSSCRFCPYHSDLYWHNLKTNHPGEFRKAAEFDRMIRDMRCQGVRGQLFLHHSLVPLDQIDFDARLNAKGPMLPGFEVCDEGYCGV